jgi:putative inorganic carbon (HCO3(-)) transporter
MRSDYRDLSPSRWIVPVLVIVVTFGLTAFVAFQYGRGAPDPANPLIIGAIALALVYLIYKQPYWGLGLIIATLPVIDTLPKLPLVTSLFPVIGAATLLAFMLQRNRMGLSLLPQRFHLSYGFGLLFVLWIFLSNPEAALRSGRGVALLTYFQLLVLLWMSGELMDNVKANRNIMWLYIAACVISAWVAVQDASIGETFDTEGKSGLGGISSSARQFVSAFIILFFVRSIIKKNTLKWLVLFTWGAQLLMLYGVTVTGSRTGILILLIGIVVILLSPTSQIKPQRIIIPAIVGFTIYTAVPSSFWDSMWNSIFPSLQEGSDTVGVRYELWETAMRMVEDKPITGVGINQFIPNVRKYSDPLSSTVVVTGAHSIYFSVLAETGVIGFVVYMGMVGASLFYSFRAAWTLPDKDAAFLAHTWFTVLVVILVGGITKQDQYDKLLWLSLGACTAMETLRIHMNQKKTTPAFNNSPHGQFSAKTSRIA